MNNLTDEEKDEYLSLLDKMIDKTPPTFEELQQLSENVRIAFGNALMEAVS